MSVDLDNTPTFRRFVESQIQEALDDTRVVLVVGPRQAGKTTLVRQFVSDERPYLSLDDIATCARARSDPVAFIRGLDRVVIDEIQRAPELMMAIKQSVDLDTRPGRFLLTGSANVMALPTVGDSLAGRIEIVTLLPLAQAEITAAPGRFIERVFAGEPAQLQGVPVFGDPLVQSVLRGGYPEALRRTSERRRALWHRERLLLLQQVRPWFSNRLSRLIKSPKLHMLDSGLLATLRGATATRIAEDRTHLGPLLESFVLAEVLKSLTWSDVRAHVSHFRTKDQDEVDLVLEDMRGRIVGIEVKSAATLRPKDFSGLRKLEEAAGSKFVQGILLHDHDRVTPYSEKIRAAPVSLLWQM